MYLDTFARIGLIHSQFYRVCSDYLRASVPLLQSNMAFFWAFKTPVIPSLNIFIVSFEPQRILLK